MIVSEIRLRCPTWPNQTATLLDDLVSREWANPATTDLILRLTAVTKATVGRLTVADRGLVAQQALNGLAGPSQELLNAVQNLAAHTPDQDPDRSQAINASDNLLLASASLPVLPIRTTPAVLGKASEQFDREVQSAIGSMSEKVDSVHTRMDEVRGELQEVTDDATALVTQLENRAAEHVTHSGREQERFPTKADGSSSGEIGPRRNEHPRRIPEFSSQPGRRILAGSGAQGEGIQRISGAQDHANGGFSRSGERHA